MIPKPAVSSRRRFLQTAACGFGSLALTSLLGERLAAAPSTTSTPFAPLAPKSPQFPARAKRVIFLFMQGGPSQVDLFAHKPLLSRDHGKPIPFNRPKDEVDDGLERSKLMGPFTKLAQTGQSGMWWSDLLPHLGSQVDRLCLLNALVADNPAHPPAVMQIQTGYTAGPHPALGSWLSYGLGSENRNLPGFITIAPIMSGDGGGPHLFGSAYLPASHQGTAILPGPDERPTISYLGRPDLPAARQREQLALLDAMNRAHLARAEADDKLEGMIQSFELAFRMQTAVPELLDIARESPATQKLYGIGDKPTDSFGRRCLLARRLAESGVRFVQVTQGGWDHHQGIRKALPASCAAVDKPIAGLLTDLHRRGLLDETVVLWAGEFGRSPYDQDISLGKDAADNFGRGHNPYGFTAWLAGGGIKGGCAYGQTDDYGYRAVADKVHLHDLHATILHQLGIDHEKLTYRHAGRDFRLTDVYGRVVQEILA